VHVLRFSPAQPRRTSYQKAKGTVADGPMHVCITSHVPLVPREVGSPSASADSTARTRDSLLTDSDQV
jgi:hypothetical protein